LAKRGIILNSTVELTELELDCEIGTYSLNDIVPSGHLLDLKLSINTELVLIETDGMINVFDYDPLIAEIARLARDSHYETQERLLTRIVTVCADQPQVTAVEAYLRKTPVTRKGGTLGIRLKVDAEHLAHLRKH
jgi:dihydroneopterin aldolase